MISLKCHSIVNKIVSAKKIFFSHLAQLEKEDGQMYNYVASKVDYETVHFMKNDMDTRFAAEVT